MYQFLKFGIVGLSNTLISYAVYSFFVFIGLHYLLASVISFAVSMCNAYYWNSKKVFKSNDNGKTKMNNSVHPFVKMVLCYAISGLLINSLLLYIFIEFFGVSEYLAPIYGLVVTVPMNFFINKHWVFK